MITEAGELGYPSTWDVHDAVQTIRENVKQARKRVAAAHHHYLVVGEGGWPPLEVRS